MVFRTFNINNYNRIMEISALQKERAAYQPKLPKALQGAVKISEGKPTQSVGDQEEIKKLFPNTYGMPLIEFVPGTEANNAKINIGVILSGGQAPGGHNVISGLFDTVKKLNPENRLLKQVTIDNAAEADEIFSMLMGDDVEPRRQFIEKNATYANIDA